MTSERKQLEVLVGGKPIGVLERTDPPKHVFTYLPNVPDSHFVSLTMPVRVESYVWDKGLHPFFQMNLPEGYRKDFLRERFGPVATVDDFALLALTGQSTLGRVTAQPLNDKKSPYPHGSVVDILSHSSSREALLQYLAETPLDALSGVMPKALAADERLTLKAPEWIIKTSREDTPGLCVNEYVCLELARRIGLPVPEAKLAKDGEVLAVARFDISKTGEPLGLEDVCSLMGMGPGEKYDASAEQMARAIMAFVSSDQKLDVSKRLVDMMVLNAAIRNADAHTKNYALLYSNKSDVTLAPAYDLITVHAYKSYVKNPYALSVGGTKGWNLRRPLERFSAERLSLNASHVGQTVARIATAMTEISPELPRLADAYPSFREPARALARIWEDGVRSLVEKSDPIVIDMSGAKFSEERPVKRPKKRTSPTVMNPEPLE